MTGRRRRTRSRRSYVVEAILVVVVLAGIWAWVNLGVGAAFGAWFAEQMTTP